MIKLHSSPTNLNLKAALADTAAPARDAEPAGFTDHGQLRVQSKEPRPLYTKSTEIHHSKKNRPAAGLPVRRLPMHVPLSGIARLGPLGRGTGTALSGSPVARLIET